MPLTTHLSLVDRLLADFERGVMPRISGGDHDDDEDGTTDPDLTDRTDESDDTLEGAGKKALQAERKARRDAERAAKDATDRLAALEAETKKRADKEAEEQGKWQELAETREADLTETTTKLESATAELDALRTYFDADYKAAFDGLPDVIKEFAPDDDADFATKSAWLTKAKAQAEKLGENETPGHRPNPKPGDGKVEIPSAVPKARMW